MTHTRTNSSAYSKAWKRKKRLTTLLVLVILVIFGIGTYLFIKKLNSRDISERGLTRGELLSSWNENKYDDILIGTKVVLQNKPVDPYYLSFQGFASFYKAVTRINNEEKIVLLDQAVVSLRKALIYPDNPLKKEVFYILGKSYFQKGYYYLDVSIEMLENAQKLGYVAHDLNEYLALAYYQLERYSKSIVYFETALEEKHSLSLCIAAAKAMLKNEDPVRARSLLDEALSEASDFEISENIRLINAESYILEKNYSSAEKEYLLILEQNSNAINAHYHLGILYQLLGDTIKARSEWRKVLKIDPAHIEARQKLK